MQCPICGREVAELIQGSCAQCRSERAAFLRVDETIEAVECAHCGRLQETGTVWKAATKDRDQRLDEVVRAKIEVEPGLSGVSLELQPTWEDPKNARATVVLRARLEGSPVERSAATRVRFKTGACPDCSREMGGYFEAVIQIRGAQGSDLKKLVEGIDETLQSRMATFHEEGRPGAFFSKIEKAPGGGRDYYTGSHEAARVLSSAIAHQYGAETDDSSKLVGRKDGRDLNRFTFLVRLPPYATGDFVVVDDRPYQVVGFDKRTLHLLDLQRHERIRRDLGRLGPVKVVGRSSDVREALVVSRHGTNLQLLDPVTYKTHDVPAAGVPKDATTVPIFWWSEALYLVLDPARQTRQ